MKNKLHNTSKFIYIGGSLLISLCINVCCSTGENMGSNTGITSIKISLKGDYFEGIDQGSIASVAIQREELIFEDQDDYKLVATLIPVNSENNLLQASTKVTPTAAIEIKPLGDKIKYKVVVYDNNGRYLKEQDYISGQEATTQEITGLKGGDVYTFIAYSVGSSIDLPVVDKSKNLRDVTIDNISGDSDLMYFIEKKEVSGNEMNYLDISLRHKFSLITTTLNVAPLNFVDKITGISDVIIKPHNTTAKIQLSDGSTTVSGASGERAVDFSTLDARSITASPVFVNSDTDGALNIKSVTIANSEHGTTVTHKNVSFSNLKIARGKKYNLNLSFVSNDIYLTYRGYPAVRLNGFIWMCHNLGADITKDAEIYSQALIGNYYQWGRKKVVADAYTPVGAISGWDNTLRPPNNAWNSGTYYVPIKVEANDPCPKGWRVPSIPDYQLFAYYLDHSGTVSVSVYNSPNNPNIKIAFPRPGYRSPVDGHLIETPDDLGYYFTSSTTPQGENWSFNSRKPTFIFRAFPDGKRNGHLLRCIAESPLE